jgi:hypothetical protein
MCSDSRLKRSAASRFALWLLPRSYFPISPAAREQRLERAGIVASSRMLVAARTGNRGFGDSAKQEPRQWFDRLPRDQAVVHRVLEREYEAAAEMAVVDLARALPTKHGLGDAGGSGDGVDRGPSKNRARQTGASPP